MYRELLIVGAALLVCPFAAAAQVEATATARAETRVESNGAAGSAEGRGGAEGMSDRVHSDARAESNTAARIGRARSSVAGRAQGEAASTAKESPRGPRTGGEAALAATIAAQLPDAPVRRLIAEGKARGASASSIDRAAFTVHSRLSASAEALATSTDGAHRSDAEIIAGAEAIAGGARPEDLEKLRDAAPPERSLAASLTALASLTASGVEPTRAVASLAAQLQAGASDTAISSMAAKAAAGGELQTGAGRIAGDASGTLGTGLGTAGIGAGLLGGVGVGLIR